MKARIALVLPLLAAVCVLVIMRQPANDAFAGSLSCTVSTSTCNSPGVVVLRLVSSTNSHAELPTMSDYPVIVCCTGVSGLGNSCAAGAHAVVVNLASTTNSHVEEGTQANYSNQACLSVSAGTVSIGYATGTCASAGYDTTLFSIASTTNSHVSATGYAINVCGTAATGTGVPVVSNVTVNGGASIVLTPATTTNVNVAATVTDPNGCSSITGGTTTVLLYRSGVTSSSCLSGSGNGVSSNLNCYVATAFTASSTCSSNAVNTTTTFPVYYFAQATDASSSFASQNWLATVIFKDSSNATGSADAASGQELLTLNAINVTTASIGYGTIIASSTTGATNQTTTVQNAGNSSTTLQISGTALTSGAHSLATSSQHFSSTTFTFGGSEQTLSDVAAGVSGFLLKSPTSTTAVQAPVYWGIQVSPGSVTGTYTATTTFTAVFAP